MKRILSFLFSVLIITTIFSITTVTVSFAETVSLSSVQTYILDQINQYRHSLGLSSIQPGPQTCSFAAIRAKEISQDFSHNGFSTRYKNHTIPYMQWSYISENLAETWDYHQVVSLWEHSPAHDANLRANTPYICVAQYGDYYAFEGMRP